jgi:hypothetical protein
MAGLERNALRLRMAAAVAVFAGWVALQNY